MNCSSHKPARAGAGFTLLELLVVLAVIASSVTAVIIFGSRSTEKAELQRDVLQLATTIREARAEALSSGAAIDLTIDAATGVYSAGQVGAGILPRKITLRVETARELMAAPTRSVIRFYPDGSTSGGRISIAAGKSVTTLTIDWLNGAVTLTRETAA